MKTGQFSNKLTARTSQPNKGIYVLKSNISSLTQRPPVHSGDEANKNFRSASHSRNIGKAFQTIEIKTTPLVGPGPEQMELLNKSTVTSPKTHFDHDFGASTHTATNRLTANDKRALIQNFLKDEQVFQLLYDTVFSSPMETMQNIKDQTLSMKTNSVG